MGNPRFKCPTIYWPITWQHQLSHMFVITKHNDLRFVFCSGTKHKSESLFLCFKYELQVRLVCNQHLLSWKHTACLETLVYQKFLTIYGSFKQRIPPLNFTFTPSFNSENNILVAWFDIRESLAVSATHWWILLNWWKVFCTTYLLPKKNRAASLPCERLIF